MEKELFDLAQQETFILVDDEGNEKEFAVMFAFEDDRTQKSYIIFYDPTEEDPEAQVCSYDDLGNLNPIESEEEMQMVIEVYEELMQE